MKSFEAQQNIPQKCELGYNQEKASCTIQLPDGNIIELTQATLKEPNDRDSYIRGFCPDRKAMGEVHLIEEFGLLSVKKVTIDGETLFETPTIH